jgi:hypothetical protein
MIKGVLLTSVGVVLAAAVVGVIIMVLSIDNCSGETKAQWPVVNGAVIGSNASESSSNDEAPSVMLGTSDENWTVVVSFEYAVNNVRYTGLQLWAANESEARSQETRYSKGAVASVYYNPKKPSSAVVEPREVYYSTLDRFVLPFLMGVPGLAFACGFLVAGIGKIREKAASPIGKEAGT